MCKLFLSVFLQVTYIAVFLLYTNERADAATRYSCDGKVQYRPCSTDLQKEESISILKANKKIIAQNFSVLPASYSRNSKSNFGEWSGVVTGEGEISLELLLFNNKDQLIEKRLMGRTFLSKKSSSFAYKGSLPQGNQGKDWHWEIAVR